ncbi:sugar ABC transporter substrate-binding protein [Thermohalobacter berrensis]|uniref:D-xylose transporter subunit XylF n=1 Tax=Thermohalobacter berrensis TaxID=99594 RepID=A0A419T6J1_9FIRM|nr:substrate-binding domain-containing protein [Thermohalobacter berrensis]RKD33180.1 D-xylose transporter subunit XylF [Thermohalobacter berrensis]
MGNFKKDYRQGIIILLITIFVILVVINIKSLFQNDHIAQSNHTSEDKEDNKIKIGFSLGTLKEERWLKDRDILMAKVRELGAEILVQNANNNDNDQIKQVKYLLEQNIDVLIIVPNDLIKASYAVELAKRKGVKVISYDRLVLNSDIDMYISFDNIKVGKLMAQYVLNKAPKGNYVIVNGPESDNNTNMIKEGYDEILRPKIQQGDIKIICEERAPNWMKEYAFKVVDKLLQKGKKIDAIIAGNDGLADGIIEALSEHRLAGKIPVVGQDADLAACQRVVEGTQLMTVYKPIEKLAHATAKVAISLARGESIDIEKTIYNGKYHIPYYVINPIAVDKYNIDDTVIKDGFHMKDDVYRNLP